MERSAGKSPKCYYWEFNCCSQIHYTRIEMLSSSSIVLFVYEGQGNFFQNLLSVIAHKHYTVIKRFWDWRQCELNKIKADKIRVEVLEVVEMLKSFDRHSTKLLRIKILSKYQGNLHNFFPNTSPYKSSLAFVCADWYPVETICSTVSYNQAT